MTNEQDMLDFVKARLEEGEGISSEALADLVDAARSEATGARRSTRRTAHRALLSAASLAIVAAGWFFLSSGTPDSADLSTTIALLRIADGATGEEADSPAENLLAWQDAPANDLTY